MENVKVLYFPIKAMAEGIRMMLAYNSQDFEDIRILKTDWPALKPKTPFGQMPILEINGRQHAQTTAILRYLGKKFGLAGNNPEEDFEIDQNIEFFNDIRIMGSALFDEKDEKKKAKMIEDLQNKHYPTMFAKLNDIISQNNGHMALGRLTWADFMFAGLYDALNVILSLLDLTGKYLIFEELHDKVINIPKVKQFCHNAPKSDY